jgi:hypothetical protein
MRSTSSARAASAPLPAGYRDRPTPSPRLMRTFPGELVARRRVAPGSLLLFDLDDTLVVATEITRAQPLVQSHAGYATVVSFGGAAATFFVAVRPLALASVVALLDRGFRVGFWSAGTPEYVRAIVQRLVDGVRHMQMVKRFRQDPSADPGLAVADAFVPAAVIALDQARMTWVRDAAAEAGPAEAVAAGHARRFAPIAPARIDAALGTVIKEPGKLAPLHPALARASPHILLVDNLRHDPLWTLQVRHFVPGRAPAGEGFGTAAAPDTVIADVAAVVAAVALGGDDHGGPRESARSKLLRRGRSH